MKSTDKLLGVIVGGAVLLVGAAMAMMLLRPKATYQNEDTPEGVAHNYLLALKKEDYHRAYGYLSESLSGYPADLDQFEETINRNSWSFRRDVDSTVTIESTEVSGKEAVVTMQEIRFYHRGLFDSSQRISTFEIMLQQNRNQSKIVDADSYFAWCWSSEDGCNY